MRLASIGLALSFALGLVACSKTVAPRRGEGDAGGNDIVIPPADAGGDAADAGDGGADAAAPLCGVAACDPTAPGQCAESLACVLHGAAPACAEAGEGDEGATCDAPADCGEGLACWREGGGGVCRRICCEDTDACGAGDTRCKRGAALVNEETTPWGRCTPRRDCDPLAGQSTCEAGESCYVISGDGLTDCRPAGIATRGMPCGDADDCAPGHACVGVGARFCRPLCILEGATPCAVASDRCLRFAFTPTGVGLCAPTGP